MVINGRQLKLGELLEMPNVYNHRKLLMEKRAEDKKKTQRKSVAKALRKGLKPIKEEPKKIPQKNYKKGSVFIVASNQFNVNIKAEGIENWGSFITPEAMNSLRETLVKNIQEEIDGMIINETSIVKDTPVGAYPDCDDLFPSISVTKKTYTARYRPKIKVRMIRCL